MNVTPHPDIPTLARVRQAAGRLEATTAPRWGEMSAPEMVEHCTRLNRMYLGDTSAPWWVKPFTRLFRGPILRKFLETSPFDFPRGVGTLPSLKVQTSEVAAEDFERARAELVDTLDRTGEVTGRWKHPLYGSIDAELGKALVRTHTAHHLNQFGVLEGGGGRDRLA